MTDRRLFEPGELAHLNACADWLGRPRHGYVVDELRGRRDLRRLKRRGREVPIDAVPEPIDATEPILDVVMRQERAERLHAAVDCLRDRQKQAIRLRLDGASVADSAKRMGCSVDNVDGLLRKARRCLCWMLAGVAACAAPPQVLDDLTKRAVTEETRPAAVLRAMSEASYAVGQPASVHVRHMPDLADVDGGLPVVMIPDRLPVAGRTFQLVWASRAVPDVRGKRPSPSCALVATLTQPGPPAYIPGARGAMLQVRPDFVFVPQRVEQASVAGPAFQQTADGIVLLRFDVPPSFDGITAWCQLLLADDRVPAGCVSTPMIELHFGSK